MAVTSDHLDELAVCGLIVRSLVLLHPVPARERKWGPISARENARTPDDRYFSIPHRQNHDSTVRIHVFYRAIEQEDVAIYWSAPELQILDNVNHPDADRGENGNRKAGSLYDLIPAAPQTFTGHGEWQKVMIVAEGPKVEHWLNGTKVLEYELWTPDWYEMIRNSKFVDHPEFGDAREGHIGLQDHGTRASFRNIMIKEL